MAVWANPSNFADYFMGMKLLLFDVDLTLINSGGAGRRAMSRAFTELFGNTNGLHKVSFAGRTDPAILREALEHHGDEWSEVIQEAFKRRYLEYLVHEIARNHEDKHVEPGVEPLLDTLNQRSDITLALLTGNWRAGARTKLEHFSLWHYFEFGAFADDAWIRNELPAVAASRFEENSGHGIAPENVYVIGDTPRDVACAQPFGARSVAVATGLYSYSQLKAANPDFLYHDLSNMNAFLNMLEGKNEI